MIPVEVLILIIDLAGTFVFAISGAAGGVRSRFDIFGVLVLSFVAGNFGGIFRDVLIGAVPPPAINDWRYLLVSIVAGLITFFWFSRVDRWWNMVLLFDAAGLALFAVSGTQKALLFGLNPVMAALLGMLTGVGGGMMRDILQAKVPIVLQADLYAVAALAAACMVVIGNEMQLPPGAGAFVGVGLCFGLRIMALRRGWRLPVATVDRSKTSRK
jgi:uncharacterized membrane protein YeiH